MSHFGLEFGDKRQILTAVVTSFPKEKLNVLLPTLKKKYKLIKENIPFVGDASAKFKDDDCTILVDAPHPDSYTQVAS